MWAKLSLTANLTPSNVYQDIARVITTTTDSGATIKASLLTANNANTEIINTVNSGWLVDNSTTNLLDIYDISSNVVAVGTVTELIWVKNAASSNAEIAAGFYLVCGSAGLATSVNGKTWVVRSTTASLVSVGVAYNGSATTMVAIIGQGSAIKPLYANDPAVWLTATTTLNYTGGTPIKLVTRGNTIYLPTSLGASATGGSITTDGITYSTTGTLPTGLLCGASDGTKVVMVGNSGVARLWNGSAWVAITGLTGLFADLVWTGSYFVGISYVGASIYVWRSTDGVTWASSSLPNYGGVDYGTQQIWFAIKWIASTSSIYVVSSTFAMQSFDHGATWVGHNIPSNLGVAAVNDVGDAVQLSTAANSLVYLASKNKCNGLFKLPCAGGTRYTYVHVFLEYISATLGYLTLRLAESFTANGYPINAAHNSGLAINCQRVDFTNGGLLMLGACQSDTERLLWCKSMLSVGNSWGSSTGNGAVIIAEYTQDDGWNNPASSYPTAAWCNTNTVTTAWYSPKYKSSVSANFVGSAAIMPMVTNRTNTKPALDAAGAVAYIVSDISIHQPTTATNAVAGGLLLGVKQGCDSIGSDGSDTQVLPSGEYFVLVAGSTLSTVRLLVPKF